MVNPEKHKEKWLQRSPALYSATAKRFIAMTLKNAVVETEGKIFYEAADGSWLAKDGPGFYGIFRTVGNVKRVWVEVFLPVDIEVIDDLVKHLDEQITGEKAGE